MQCQAVFFWMFAALKAYGPPPSALPPTLSSPNMAVASALAELDSLLQPDARPQDSVRFQELMAELCRGPAGDMVAVLG